MLGRAVTVDEVRPVYIRRFEEVYRLQLKAVTRDALLQQAQEVAAATTAAATT